MLFELLEEVIVLSKRTGTGLKLKLQTARIRKRINRKYFERKGMIMH